jgi:PAS domain S-box-containing protein
MKEQTSEPNDLENLLKRLEQVERENKDLRIQLHELQSRTHRAGMGDKAEAYHLTDVLAPDHRHEMAAAAFRFDELKLSHDVLNANEALLRESERRLQESEQKLRKITDNLPALIAYVDAQERYRFNNKAYEIWLGRTPESLYGMSLIEAVGAENYERVKAHFQAALAGKRSQHEWWGTFKDKARFVRSEYIPDFDPEGRVAGFFVLASDLTEIRRSQDALTKSETRLRLALDASRMAIWESETETGTITVSPELNRLFGFPPEAKPTLDEFRARYAPGGRESLQKAALEAISRNSRYAEAELQIVLPEGTQRWLMLRAEIQGGADGRPLRSLGVALDLTERKRAEEHQRLLINELNHRVKNTLATVQSIASQSLRNADSAADAREAVEGRLIALSRAHDILTRENWDGAFLREIVNQVLETFQGQNQTRFRIDGRDVRLAPRIALSVAMALQELGTNAVKYGALSNEAGQVSIRWELVGELGSQTLELVWQEMNGPAVNVPSRKGFGTRLIERSLAQELNGEAKITFPPGGVVCTIRAPLAEGEATAPLV